MRARGIQPDSRYDDAERTWPQHAHSAPVHRIRKAFGHAIPWRDVGVTHERSGRPGIALYGKAAELIERRGVRAIHLTITHTATTAAAVVILEG